MDRGAQNLEIGRGKSGDILRNLLLEVSHHKDDWAALVKDIQELFNVTLRQPEYAEALPFILCEYLGGIPAEGKGKGGLPQFDIASGGSGFHQVLLLLSFFYARPATVFLLDEPDAHLHVILQRQIYDRLRTVASRRECQLIIATPLRSNTRRNASVTSCFVPWSTTSSRSCGPARSGAGGHEPTDDSRFAVGRTRSCDLVL